MLAQYCCFGIAQETLRAGVPTGNVAIGRKEEGGVVINVLLQEVETLLTLPQGLAGAAAFRDVADHAMTSSSPSACTGLRLISVGNSLPSCRWPYRSSPAPIGRVRACS